MDGSRFDHLARTWGTRRTAIGGLLAGALLPLLPEAGDARKKRHHNGRDRDRRKRNRGANARNKHHGPNHLGAEKKKKKKCKGGTIKCGKKLCVNASTDARNCGACGNACGAGRACVGGTCQQPPSAGTCPTGQILCGGGCVDPKSDETHCGGCSVVCQGDLTCLDGTCGCADPRDTTCGNQCVDIQSDTGNCGQCGQACGSGKRCQGGQCVTTMCGANEILCNGSCVPSIGTHPCCSQFDCGGTIDSSNHIYCDMTQHQCRCVDSNYGICQRTPDRRGLCNECCAGGIGALNCKGEMGCNGLNFCTCPAGSAKCPGGDYRCYQDPANADGTLDDPTTCFDGVNCNDCTHGGTKPYVCCWSRTCVDASGLKPNFGGSLGTFCGGCEKCPPDKMCCNNGDGTEPKCKTPVSGGFCPLPGID